jgi:hypothetical protein
MQVNMKELDIQIAEAVLSDAKKRGHNESIASGGQS